MHRACAKLQQKNSYQHVLRVDYSKLSTILPCVYPRSTERSWLRWRALAPSGDVEHRRDALWQVEHAGRPVGPLLRGNVSAQPRSAAATPLRKMTNTERLLADYTGTG